MSDDDKLVTRNECRRMGLDVSNTQFQRYEAAGGLTPLKAGGVRSAQVRYLRSQVETFLGLRR